MFAPAPNLICVTAWLPPHYLVHDRVSTYQSRTSHSYTVLSRRLSLNSSAFASAAGASPASASSAAVSRTTSGDVDPLFGATGAGVNHLPFDDENTTVDWESNPGNGAWLAVEGDWFSQLSSPTSNSPASVMPPATSSGEAGALNSHKRQLPETPQISPSFATGTMNGDSVSTAPWLESASFFSTPDESFHARGKSSAEATLQQLPAHVKAAETIMHRDRDGRDDLLPQQDDLIGKVSLVVEHCDRDTLGHLLKMYRSLKGKGKLQIDHAEL